jgi:hypothetical protein
MYALKKLLMTNALGANQKNLIQRYKCNMGCMTGVYAKVVLLNFWTGYATKPLTMVANGR